MEEGNKELKIGILFGVKNMNRRYENIVEEYTNKLKDPSKSLNDIRREYSNYKIVAKWGINDFDQKVDSNKEDELDHRTPFQHDIARIIHSKAFRRLKYKTQVYISYEEDHNRTRLTHSLEVMQIATSIARTIGLNEDLVSAISLGHDLGHTPFGHAGEEILDEISRKELNQPFKHNIQSIRVVEELADDYSDDLDGIRKGLGLTCSVREGILKHTDYYKVLNDKNDMIEFKQKFKDKYVHLRLNNLPTNEAQLVNVADEIAQRCHDLDDWMRSDNSSDVIWKKIREVLINGIKCAKLYYEKDSSNKRKNSLKEKLDNYLKKIEARGSIEEARGDHDIVRGLINIFSMDLILSSLDKLFVVNEQMDEKEISSGYANDFAVCFSDDIKKLQKNLSDCQYKMIYSDNSAQMRNERAKYFIRNMFYAYKENPLILSNKTLKKYFLSIGEQGVDENEIRSKEMKEYVKRMRDSSGYKMTIIDFIAGMTDSYVQEQYSKIFTPINK